MGKKRLQLRVDRANLEQILIGLRRGDPVDDVLRRQIIDLLDPPQSYHKPFRLSNLCADIVRVLVEDHHLKVEAAASATAQYATEPLRDLAGWTEDMGRKMAKKIERAYYRKKRLSKRSSTVLPLEVVEAAVREVLSILNPRD